MTIFGNVRQWNRPRALCPRGVKEIGKNPSGLGAPIVRGPLSPTLTTAAFLERGVRLASARPGAEPGDERRVRLLPSRASSSSSWATSPAASSAPPSKVESGVDVSGWIHMVRGWRIKSVELNSCHCSDSSWAERRGSERDSERSSAGTESERESARKKEGERKREGEARRARLARPGAGTGCRSTRREATSLSTAQPGAPRALSHQRDLGDWTGACRLVLS